MFYDGNCADGCMFPENEDVMLCVRAKLGLKEGEMDDKVNADHLRVTYHLRERRNRKAHVARECLDHWQESMHEDQLTAKGMEKLI